MLALPPAPERKLLTGHSYFIGMDVASGPDYTVKVLVRETWIDGELIRTIGDIMEVLPNPYWHGKAPWGGV